MKISTTRINEANIRYLLIPYVSAMLSEIRFTTDIFLKYRNTYYMRLFVHSGHFLEMYKLSECLASQLFSNLKILTRRFQNLS
jgi:hypothetical protein